MRSSASTVVSASIAVQRRRSSRYKSYDKLAPADPEYEIAHVMSGIVKALEGKRRTAKAPLLPAGTALNVNFPKFARVQPRNCASYLVRKAWPHKRCRCFG